MAAYEKHVKRNIFIFTVLEMEGELDSAVYKIFISKMREKNMDVRKIWRSTALGPKLLSYLYATKKEQEEFFEEWKRIEVLGTEIEQEMKKCENKTIQTKTTTGADSSAFETYMNMSLKSKKGEIYNWFPKLNAMRTKIEHWYGDTYK